MQGDFTLLRLMESTVPCWAGELGSRPENITDLVIWSIFLLLHRKRYEKVFILDNKKIDFRKNGGKLLKNLKTAFVKFIWFLLCEQNV